MSRTTTRAEEYAAQLETLNAEIVATVDGCTEEQWGRPCAGDQRSVGVVAHHVSEVQRFFAEAVAGEAADAVPLPSLTTEFVDENNARHARDFADISKPEVLDALRTNGATLVRVVGGLSDEDLNRSLFLFDGHELSGAQVVEMALIGHFNEHLASMRAAIAN